MVLNIQGLEGEKSLRMNRIQHGLFTFVWGWSIELLNWKKKPNFTPMLQAIYRNNRYLDFFFFFNNWGIDLAAIFQILALENMQNFVFFPVSEKIGVGLTLWCQLEDTVLLIGTLLKLDPVLFPKYEAWLLIGKKTQFWSTSRAGLFFHFFSLNSSLFLNSRFFP